MPSPRTEASELAVGFGILALDPLIRITDDQRAYHFQSSLPQASYKSFLNEYSHRPQLHSRMYEVGLQLRSSVPEFQNVDSLRWAGPDKQASTISAASDLLVANIPVSVKAISNVVANPSPHNLIYNLPSGQAFSQNERNWYVEQSPKEFQDLYSHVRASDPRLTYLPASVTNFEKIATSDDRDLAQLVIADYNRAQSQAFTRIYLQMCHAVALASALEFSSRMSNSMKGRARTAIIENVMRWFFRLDAVPYILCGLDANDQFGLQVPSLTDFKSRWDLDIIQANADLARRQSVVDFELRFSSKANQSSYVANFHTELRWSHGRFCGAPEAKLYKDFHYYELPFFHRLI